MFLARGRLPAMLLGLALFGSFATMLCRENGQR
jgi:hypothetical protein